MSNRLSHSAINKYMDCPTAYRLHYIDKLRSNTMSAALLFGTAIDKAVEKLIHSRDLKEAKKVFNILWQAQEINGVLTDLRNCPDIVYANNDYDEELCSIIINPNIKLFKDDKGFDNLPKEEKVLYNNYCWSMAKKRGELMLEAYNDEVIPKLGKIYSTQEKIDLSNGNGDSVIGYVDLVADFEGYSSPVVLDNKTSTRAYEADSVKTSAQLTLYVHALEEKYKTRKAGFIVLSKQIQKNRKKICSVCGHDGTGGRHKTCDNELPFQNAAAAGASKSKSNRCNGEWKETINPKAKIDIIIDDIPEQMENIVLENFDGVSKMIDNGVFIRNLNSCKRPWGLCDFYNKCHGNSDKGLVKIENNK